MNFIINSTINAIKSSEGIGWFCMVGDAGVHWIGQVISSTYIELITVHLTF